MTPVGGQLYLIPFLSMKWNLIKLDGPAHGIAVGKYIYCMNKIQYKVLPFEVDT